MAYFDPRNPRFAPKMHYTRSFTSRYFGGNPIWAAGLPDVTRPRGPAQVGHPGPSPWPLSDNDDDSITTLSGGIGEPAQEEDENQVYSHVRSTAGGYVNFWSMHDNQTRSEWVKWKREQEKRRKRTTRVGGERRRWVYRNGRNAGKQVGAQRRRDDRGRWV